MGESDDYKRGWYDGYNARNKPQTYPTDLPGLPGPTVAGVTCSKCGMVWQGAMGYSCPQFHCPVQLKATF